jgi:hypothetical protein
MSETLFPWETSLSFEIGQTIVFENFGKADSRLGLLIVLRQAIKEVYLLRVSRLQLQ